MHIPGLHLFYDAVAEPFSRQHHKIIAQLIPLHPRSVVHKKTCRLIGGIVGIQLILVKACLPLSIIKERCKLQKEHDSHNNNKGGIFFPLERTFHIFSPFTQIFFSIL